MTKIGIAGHPRRLEEMKSIGYDRMELSAGFLSEMSDEELAELKQKIAAIGIEVVSCHTLIPKTGTPLWEDPDFSVTTAYLQQMFPILQDFGIQTVIFGCGSIRKMPEDMPEEERFSILCRFFDLLCPMAKEYGMRVVIEPLNSKETNTINTTAQAMKYIKACKYDNLGLLIDLYHFHQEGEPLERVYEYAPCLQHVHVAEPTQRFFLRDTDEYDYGPFFKALQETGYAGPVVFEGGKDKAPDGPVLTMNVLKKYLR